MLWIWIWRRIGSDPHHFADPDPADRIGRVPVPYQFKHKYFLLFSRNLNMLKKIFKILTHLPFMRKEKAGTAVKKIISLSPYFPTRVKSVCKSASLWYHSGSGSAISMKFGSGSASKRCRSTTLLFTVPHMDVAGRTQSLPMLLGNSCQVTWAFYPRPLVRRRPLVSSFVVAWPPEKRDTPDIPQSLTSLKIIIIIIIIVIIIKNDDNKNNNNIKRQRNFKKFAKFITENEFFWHKLIKLTFGWIIFLLV